MTISEILRAGKARLTPETWRGFNEPGLRAESLCAHLAVVTGFDTTEHVPNLMPALRLLASVATGTNNPTPFCAIWRWNDEPGQILQNIHDAFDAAICIAEQREGVITSELEYAEV